MPKKAAEQIPLEEFGLLEGSSYDKFRGSIDDVFFGTKDDYSNSTDDDEVPVLMNVKFLSPELETSADKGYSTGKAMGWAIVDNGARVESEAQPGVARFPKNSNTGRLILSLMKSIGKGDVAKGQAWFHKRQIPMTDAQFYQGLGEFQFDTFEFPAPEGKTTKVTLATEWFGNNGNKPPVAAGKASLPKKPAAGTTRSHKETSDEGSQGTESPPGDSVSNESDYDPELVAAVLALANGKTHEEFRRALIKAKDIKESYPECATLTKAIFKEDWRTASRYRIMWPDE